MFRTTPSRPSPAVGETIFELDLVLRNNLTTAEHPLGLYHPHEALHHIKKENIGLIEVMGLAVLPSRLDRELALLKDAILQDRDLRADETLQKHADWAEELKTRYTFKPENAEEILKQEVGAVFMQVLEDAGVYKVHPGGPAGLPPVRTERIKQQKAPFSDSERGAFSVWMRSFKRI